MSGPRLQVDWDAVRAAVAARPPLGPDGMSPARAEAMLAERTRNLALSRAERRTSDRWQRVIRLRVGAERVALPVVAAREAVGLGRVTALPGVGAPILGVIGWRGEFLTVFDLAALLAAAVPVPGRRRAVVLAGAPVALAVDAIEGIAAIDMGELKPTVGLLSAAAQIFCGITGHGVAVIDETALATHVAGALRAA